MSERREIWGFQSEDESGWDNGFIEVTAYPDGLTVEVTQDKAVDSYNQQFTCGVTLSREKAVELRDMLDRHLAATAETPAP